MLTKLIKGTALLALMLSFNSQAGVLKFDDCDSITPTEFDLTSDDGCEGATDYLGDRLVYSIDGGTLTVTSESSMDDDGVDDDVIQDRQGNNAGLGSSGDPLDDNSGLGEWLAFTFNFDIQLNQIHFNGGKENGRHGDQWDDVGSVDEIYIALYDDEMNAVVGKAFDLTGKGFLFFEDLYIAAGWTIKIMANNSFGNHYVEAIAYEAGFRPNCVPNLPNGDCVEVPEPNVLFLLGFTIVGIALRRKQLFK